MKKPSAVATAAIAALLFVGSTTGLAQSQPGNTAAPRPGSANATQTEVISEAPPFETLGDLPSRPVEPSGTQSLQPGPVINEPPPETFTPSAPSQVRPRQPDQFQQRDIRSFELPPTGQVSPWPRGDLEPSPFGFSPGSRLESGSHDRCGHSHENAPSGMSEIDPLRPLFRSYSTSSPDGCRYSRENVSERECGFNRRCGARTICPFSDDTQSSAASFSFRPNEFISRPTSQELEAVRREVARLISAVEFEPGPTNYELVRNSNRLDVITRRLEWLESEGASSAELLAEVRGVVVPLRNIKSSLGNGSDTTRALLATRDVGATLLRYVRRLNETMDSRVPTSYPRTRWGN